MGHHANECRQKRSEQERGVVRNQANNPTIDNIIHLFCASLLVTINCKTCSLDSGCTCQMTPHREWFHDLAELKTPSQVSMRLNGRL